MKIATSTAFDSLNQRLRAIDPREVILMAIGIGLAIVLRFSLREFVTGDFTAYLGPWYSTLKTQGLAAFRSEFSDYPPLFLYMLYLMSALFPGMQNVSAIKVPSSIFDFVAAFFIYRIVRLKFKQGPLPQIAFLAVIYAPTVVVNSSLWGQVDSIYTTCLIACLYYLMKERVHPSMIALGLAFALKPQSVFIAPLLATLYLKRKVPIWGFFWVPVIYVLSIVPAWLAGGDFAKLLTIYLFHFSLLPQLTLNAPTVYALMPLDKIDPLLGTAGLIWAFAGSILLALVVARSDVELTPGHYLHLTVLGFILMPFALPHSHERYFYPADVLTIALAFYDSRYVYLPVIMGFTSLMSYLMFIMGYQPVPLAFLALVVLGLITVLAHHLLRELYSPSQIDTSA